MKKLIIGNWKMNPSTLKDAKKLAASIERRAKNTVVICPPTIYMSEIDYPNLGAQDCFWAEKGPFTGQTSPKQLKGMKVRYCLVGHSEKRAVGETDEHINLKIKALIEVGIIPVLCVGFGTTVEQDDLEVVDVLRKQLDAGLFHLDTSKVVVAYEPVWAISSGDPYATKKVATPEHAEKISIYIKNRYKVSKVIYGGSANLNNAQSFLEQPNIDGLLPGGASLIPSHFNQIINF
jgi:triosephosphate isomerase